MEAGAIAIYKDPEDLLIHYSTSPICRAIVGREEPAGQGAEQHRLRLRGPMSASISVMASTANLNTTAGRNKTHAIPAST
jgi:hypothetical protein